MLYIHEYLVLTNELVMETDLKHEYGENNCCLYVDINHRIYIMGGH